jgi:hypothetical protein
VEMGKETFLLLFVSGSAALAAWVAVCRPRLAPTSFRAGTVHLIAAVVVGGVLGPLVHAVPGLPSRLSVLAALFAVALPSITYMLLVGMWLIQLAVASAAPGRR